MLLSAGDHRFPKGGTGGGNIALFGRGREPRITFTVEGDGTPHLDVYGADGKSASLVPLK